MYTLETTWTHFLNVQRRIMNVVQSVCVYLPPSQDTALASMRICDIAFIYRLLKGMCT